MSSTTLPRNEKRLDFYRTPEWVTRAIAPKVRSALNVRDRSHGSVPRPERWSLLDAGAGDGAICNVLAREFAESTVVGVECDATKCHDPASLTRPQILFGDFFRWEASPCAIVMNPPFSQAREFIEHGIELVQPQGGCVFALLRLAWMAGQARSAFHRAHPSDVYVLPRRPSFTGGGTDSADYGWFAWRGPDTGGRWSVLDTERTSR